MGQVLEFPGQLPDNLVVRWDPEQPGPKKLDIDLSKDHMYSVSSSEGNFLFNILVASGRLFVSNPDEDYFDYVDKNEFARYSSEFPFPLALNGRDRMILDWVQQDVPFLEFCGDATSIQIVDHNLPRSVEFICWGCDV